VCRARRHTAYTLFARVALVAVMLFRASSARYVARVRMLFARCRTVSRVVNSHRLEALELIKLLIYLTVVSIID
jgi:putative copper export protein